MLQFRYYLAIHAFPDVVASAPVTTGASVHFHPTGFSSIRVAAPVDIAPETGHAQVLATALFGRTTVKRKLRCLIEGKHDAGELGGSLATTAVHLYTAKTPGFAQLIQLFPGGWRFFAFSKMPLHSEFSARCTENFMLDRLEQAASRWRLVCGGYRVCRVAPAVDLRQTRSLVL